MPRNMGIPPTRSFAVTTPSGEVQHFAAHHIQIAEGSLQFYDQCDAATRYAPPIERLIAAFAPGAWVKVEADHEPAR